MAIPALTGMPDAIKLTLMLAGSASGLRLRAARRGALGPLLAWLVLCLASPTLPGAVFATPMNEHVILLHGLCRSSSSMRAMERALTDAGYRVWNIDYPSRTNTVAHL